jgi:hypothetical protein
MVVTKVSSTTALKSCCWLRLGGICLPSRLARELLLEIKAWSPAVWKCTAVRHCVNPPFPNVCWAKNWTTVPDKRHKGNRIKIPGAKMKKKKKPHQTARTIFFHSITVLEIRMGWRLIEAMGGVIRTGLQQHADETDRAEKAATGCIKERSITFRRAI